MYQAAALSSLLLPAFLLAVAPLEAAADAALVPVPVTTSGFTLPPGELFSSFEGEEGDPPVPLAAPVTVVSVSDVCTKTSGSSFPIPIPPSVVCTPGAPQAASFDDGAISLTTPTFQLQATLVSGGGSQWEVELVDPVLNITNLAVPGTPITGPTTVRVRIVIDAFPSATFDIPDATPAPSESIAFRRLPPNLGSETGLPLLEARSETLGSSARPFTPGLVEDFLEDDLVTLVGRVRYELSYQTLLFPGQVFGPLVFERIDPCGSATGPAGLPPRTCRVGYALSAAHAATPTASLACRADLTGDGVVNFADLARLRSVFLQACTPP